MDFNRKYLNGHRIAGFRRAGGISIGYGGCGGAGCSVAENGLWYVVAVNGNIYAIPAFLLIALIFRRKHQNIIGIGLILLISGGIVLFSYATTPAQAEQIEIFYQLNDHLDTPVRVADQYGNLVNDSKLEPFGNVAYEYSDPAFAYENNFRFPGQYHDRESGLYYNWNRYYVPGLGIYNSSDPKKFKQSSCLSSSWAVFSENNYAYANGNPAIYTDISGLEACCNSGKSKDCPGGRWIAGNFVGEAYLGFLRHLNVGGIVFSGVISCTSAPIRLLFFSYCDFAGADAARGSLNIKGAGGVGGGGTTCKGLFCKEDISSLEWGKYIQVGPITAFDDTGDKGCSGVFGVAGGGLGAGGFVCDTIVQEF